jgi:hypothetical protein
VTDFLSRLVERSTGRAAVARPVVPPLFAAGAALGAGPVEEEAMGGTGSAEGPVATVGEAFRPHPPASDAPTVSDTSAPALPVEEGRAEEVTPPGRERPPAPRTTVTRDRLRVRIVRDAAAAMAPDGAPLTAPEAGEKARPAPASGPESQIALHPREAAVFPRAAAVRGDASTSPPAPIVRISIGRVDVRAVPPARPAAPSPAPVRKDDRLSLEEYLRPRDRRP